MAYKSRISAGNFCCMVSQERFLARKIRIRAMSILPKLFLGVEYCATFQAALYIETHSLMHQSEFHAASVALSRAADKRKSLINIHKNGYTATLIVFTTTKYTPLFQCYLSLTFSNRYLTFNYCGVMSLMTSENDYSLQEISLQNDG